jgi:hypothetical protein
VHYKFTHPTLVYKLSMFPQRQEYNKFHYNWLFFFMSI